jgi:hypothetical protein
LALTILRAALIAVIVDTDFLELAAMLLLLRLRFLITSVTPWRFCRGEKTEFNMIPSHRRACASQQHPRTWACSCFLPLGTNRPNASVCGHTLNHVHSRRAEPPHIRVDCQECPDPPHDQSHIYPGRSRVRNMPKDRANAPPLSQTADNPTAENHSECTVLMTSVPAPAAEGANADAVVAVSM